MLNILFVCLGNICRSPLAEAIFNQKVKERGLNQSIKADSAGTASYHIGEDPDSRSIQVAVKHGVPIVHKGRQYHFKDAATFDYILAMDASNHRDIIHATSDRPEGLFLMRDFDPEGQGGDVPDPYYGGEDGFEKVFQILDRSIDAFLDFLVEKHHL
ncbi:low molecular weight protein-tyrosine-phosphatase [Marinoscillum sp. 108]|uniref:low molecular weight protein-tyrosine-phosphatase n=1 Tax=Marinoscillum sp. 108 TaxID=2653151 RepID=UPI0012EFFB4D|nr:low molecular weight protein-tyrosine-phosphatase [Marinoscillum sp. 108]VXD16592.1 putative Protein-tyrosine-phosphatase [Marinoscillum sp. 108]